MAGGSSATPRSTGIRPTGVDARARGHRRAALAPRGNVCENPAVLRRAAGELGASSPPLICAEGRPSTAFHRLARLIVNGGGRLLYHGDFDWPGIDMTNQLIYRYGAEPWKMTAEDYLEGLRTEDDQVALSGKARSTSWDPDLSTVMQEHQAAVYEEGVADALLAELGGLP
ncbi:DUF2399 domain-containing protein [Streptomyces sp. RP5T]|uniref:DUF2399 domain-containing protein n=1 Tax=Streptomyces sp. RP5T TaxID=2490848 RepID=UPI0021ADBE63|nr:DUF2399 domain-containing protein [Streptomyces sp. RP5T]